MNNSGYVYLTRRERFCASHRLHSPHLTDEENRQLYHRCNYDNGHGHNYELFVTIRGIPDPKTGILIFIDELKEIVRRVIIDRVDHRHLNLDIPELKNVIPTAENLVVEFWKWLVPELPTGILYEIKLTETENNTSFYRG
jgi:6-pyruvoyltetrahydropterin/6-carboxytetrahydropterin synthase